LGLQNDRALIENSFAETSQKEPSGLVRQDGKRPDRLILIAWQGGKSLAWDVTVVSTLVQSCVDRAAIGVGMVAELAAERKLMKYSNFPINHLPAYCWGKLGSL